jgi:hypothetical protein
VRSRPPTTRSRGREYPGLGQGQAKVQYRHVPRLYPVCFHSPLRRRPDAATWTIARDVSQWMEPDIRPLGRAATAFIMEKTCRLSIPLTCDVPPRHLMCPVHRLAGGVQAILQAACLSSLLSNSTPVLRGVLCPSSPIRYQGSFPCTPILCRSRMSGHKKIVPVANISCSKYYICYIPGPTCRGSVPLYVPP